STGQILARAQWPDYDPAAPIDPKNRADWHRLRQTNDPKFMGIYGPWADKTGGGVYGYLQAGSVFKLGSSIAAIRAGLVKPADDAACPVSADPRFICGPEFSLPGWTKPIHNHGDGGGSGSVDLITALAQSSNVYFGQLGLALGPQPYRDLLN